MGLAMRSVFLHGLAVLTLCLCASAVLAANTPCSGKKGGIARCDGDLFLCNDGSISGSKRSCTAYLGGGSGGSSRRAQPLLGDGAGCPCGTGTLCVGPRGGEYCLTPSGKKSYRRK